MEIYGLIEGNINISHNVIDNNMEVSKGDKVVAQNISGELTASLNNLEVNERVIMGNEGKLNKIQQEKHILSGTNMENYWVGQETRKRKNDKSGRNRRGTDREDNKKKSVVG